MTAYGQLLRQTLIGCYKDNILGIAKGAAYSALLSFFPVLTTLTAILVQANAHAVSRNLSAIVFSVVPPGTEEIVRYNFTERGQRPIALLVVAVLVSIWAASGVMMSLMEGFRSAYRIPARTAILAAARYGCAAGDHRRAASYNCVGIDRVWFAR